MPFTIYPFEMQHKGGFNGGEILENKPIQLTGEEGKLQPYSNIFYWAHAWSDNGSTIGLHPHKGFEIMSFVLNGSIEHYDTAGRQWLPLRAGDAQIIRSGSGIAHSERINANSDIFQIWLDPDLSQTLGEPASYDDYTSEEFPVEDKDSMQIKTYVGERSPMKITTPGVRIQEISVPDGRHEIPLDESCIYSVYLIEGELSISDETLRKDGFVKIQEEEKFTFRSAGKGRIFLIESPKQVPYTTYSDRYLRTA